MWRPLLTFETAALFTTNILMLGLVSVTKVKRTVHSAAHLFLSRAHMPLGTCLTGRISQGSQGDLDAWICAGSARGVTEEKEKKRQKTRPRGSEERRRKIKEK